MSEAQRQADLMTRESSSNPLVSICVPTYNGGKWIRECLDSALKQTYQPVEILVVDDCSNDDTIEKVRSIGSERIRLQVNDQNRGLVGNWNECLRLSKGEFIKFLFQDDWLAPDCVEKMVRLCRQDARTGLVFSRRELFIEGAENAEAGREWAKKYGELQAGYKVSVGRNDGRSLFLQHMEKKFFGSCVGEPTTVLIKKECFERVGLFNPRLYQVADIEMWLRIMYYYDVGFIDEKLSTVRFHSASTTSTNRRKKKPLFDQLWLLEGLLSHEEIRREHPEIVRLRDYQLAMHSPLRPSAGWRSLVTPEGFRRALSDAALISRRTRFLMTYYAQRFRETHKQDH